MNENDLRVRRTRRLLQEALIELTNRRNYDQITIRDITQAAQVGYKTFFRHYESKEALMKAIVVEFMERFRQTALPLSRPNAIRHNTTTALQLIMANRKMYQAILNSPTATELLKPALAMAYEDAEQFVSQSTLPSTLIGNHFATSMLGLFTWCLNNEDMYSVEEMVEFIDQLLIQPIERLQTSEEG